MKKIFLFIVTFFIVTTAYADEKVCTMEYAPVCGKVQVQCIKAPCEPVLETFSNKCMLESNGFATFLYEGECSQNPKDLEPRICTMEYNPVCGEDGNTYSNPCQAGDIEIKHYGTCEGSEFLSNTGSAKICTREYKAVCAQPKMPVCPEGMSCIQMMPIPKEYGNKCMMEADGAEFLYDGNCESNLIEPLPIKEDEQLVCTMEYAPVCGVDGKTYGNSCSAGKVEIKHTGECLSKTTSSKLQKSVITLLNQAYKKVGNEQAFVKLMENALKNVEKQIQKQDVWSKKYAAYMEVQDYFQTYLQQNILNPYIKANIANITDEKPLVGGKWYVTEISWQENIATISYEDGHFALQVTGTFSHKDGKIIFQKQ